MDSILEDIVRMLSALSLGKTPALLDTSSVSGPLLPLMEAANSLAASYHELHAFTLALSEGQLDSSPPSRANYISGFLKELQSHLLGLTWQAQQVAKGDYSQRVDFMGDFSEAFNTMVEKLAERENDLREKIEEITLANEQIDRSKQMLTRVLESLRDLVIVTRGKKLLYANSTAREEMGLVSSSGPLLPKRPSPLLAQMVDASGASDRPDRIEVFETVKKRWYSVSFIPMDWEGEEALLLVASDVTHAKHKQIELEFIANMDVLTGVMNRRGGLAAFELMLSDPDNYPVSVCFLDIDGLKKVNDTYGHDLGDEYIVNTVETITECLRDKDVVSRIGGDEIMLLFARTPTSEAEKALDRIHERLAQREKELQTIYPMGLSSGVSTAEVPGVHTASELLNAADYAMYLNKNAKREPASRSETTGSKA